MLTKQEIRQLGNREMTDELQRTRRELLKLQFDVRSGTSKEAHMVKNLRRYIARLETLAKEMKMEAKTNMGKAEAAPVSEEPKKATTAQSAPAEAPTKKIAAKKTTAAKTPAKAAKPAKSKSTAKK